MRYSLVAFLILQENNALIKGCAMKLLCPFLFMSRYAEYAKGSVVIFNLTLLKQGNNYPQKALTSLSKSCQIGSHYQYTLKTNRLSSDDNTETVIKLVF
jgi:hypothetical protein